MCGGGRNQSLSAAMANATAKEHDSNEERGRQKRGWLDKRTAPARLQQRLPSCGGMLLWGIACCRATIGERRRRDRGTKHCHQHHQQTLRWGPIEGWGQRLMPPPGTPGRE